MQEKPNTTGGNNPYAPPVPPVPETALPAKHGAQPVDMAFLNNLPQSKLPHTNIATPTWVIFHWLACFAIPVVGFFISVPFHIVCALLFPLATIASFYCYNQSRSLDQSTASRIALCSVYTFVCWILFGAITLLFWIFEQGANI